MLTIAQLTVALAWTAIGIAGLWGGVDAHAPHATLSLVAGLGLVSAKCLTLTYRRAGTPWPEGPPDPVRIDLGPLAALKSTICWFHAFEHNYAVAPGLYFTGAEYDRETPLLVTGNYHLTIWTLLRSLRGTPVRVLVVDTDGINVWCAAGKGSMSNTAIEAQLARYDRELLTAGKWLTLVLPKLAFAGVDLRALRDAGIRPVIGPIYARELRAFLADERLRDRDDDCVHFGWGERTFTWLPGLVQALGYSLAVALVILALQRGWTTEAPLVVVAVGAAVATVYPLFFPWIPGRRFAVKGLTVGVVIGLLAALPVALGVTSPAAGVALGLYAAATGIFFGLAYTGNSAVSNYSSVRREIARFLPIEVALYVASGVVFLAFGATP